MDRIDSPKNTQNKPENIPNRIQHPIQNAVTVAEVDRCPELDGYLPWTYVDFAKPQSITTGPCEPQPLMDASEPSGVNGE